MAVSQKYGHRDHLKVVSDFYELSYGRPLLTAFQYDMHPADSELRQLELQFYNSSHINVIFRERLKGEVVPVLNKSTHHDNGWGGEGMSPLSRGINWRRVVNFKPRPFIPCKKKVTYRADWKGSRHYSDVVENTFLCLSRSAHKH